MFTVIVSFIQFKTVVGMCAQVVTLVGLLGLDLEIYVHCTSEFTFVHVVTETQRIGINLYLY